MSKDPSNPFSMLNARDFPSRNQRENTQKARRAKTVVKNRASAPDEAADDPDAELFLQFMGGGVRSLEPKENTSKAQAKRPARQAEPAPTKERSPFRLEDGDGDNPFAKALGQEVVKRMVKKKGAAAPAAPAEPEVPAEEEVPATLTAMALAGARIARRDDALLMDEAAGKASDVDDSRDFFSAVKGTKPLGGSGRDVPMEPEAPPVPVFDPRHPLQDFMEGKVEFSVACTDEYAEGHVLGLDLMLVSQLQSRQFSPEAHIDLHGLNSEQAFQNLVGFFRSSYYKGVRVALVVTGRGLNSLNGVPVLRSRVQEWFTHDPFKRVVLAFCTAKQEDGGAGAFYVLLRKFKKSAGKIRWDAMPADTDLYL